MGCADHLAQATGVDYPPLVGSLLGAGTLFARDAVRWHALVVKVIEPLLLSVFIAWAVSAVLASGIRVAARQLARSAQSRRPIRDQILVGPGASAETISTATPEPTNHLGLIGAAHWLTSGLSSFARGLNDSKDRRVMLAYGYADPSTPHG
jgi:phosphate/sulfate permease